MRHAHHAQLCDNPVCLLVGFDSQLVLISVDSCCAGRHAVYNVPSGYAEAADATGVTGYKVFDLPSLQSHLSYFWQRELLLDLCCYCNNTACSLQEWLQMHISVHAGLHIPGTNNFWADMSSLKGSQGSYMH